MPAPTHLLPIIEQLGDGATVAHAEIVAKMIADACASVVPPDVAALQDQLTEMRARYDDACALVARMHAAAVGEVCGPIRGVVEDVEDVRTCWLNAEARIKHLESLPETIAAIRADQPDTLTDAEVTHHTDQATAELRDLLKPQTGPHDISAWMGVREPAVDDDEPEIDWDDDTQPETDCRCGHQDSESTDGLPCQAKTHRPDDATTPPEVVSGPTNAEVRAWCIANGVPVNAKGSVRADARTAYDTAHRA